MEYVDEFEGTEEDKIWECLQDLEKNINDDIELAKYINYNSLNMQMEADSGDIKNLLVQARDIIRDIQNYL